VIGVSTTRLRAEFLQQALADLVGALILGRLPRPSGTRASSRRISSAMPSRKRLAHGHGHHLGARRNIGLGGNSLAGAAGAVTNRRCRERARQQAGAQPWRRPGAADDADDTLSPSAAMIAIGVVDGFTFSVPSGDRGSWRACLRRRPRLPSSPCRSRSRHITWPAFTVIAFGLISQLARVLPSVMVGERAGINIVNGHGLPSPSRLQASTSDVGVEFFDRIGLRRCSALNSAAFCEATVLHLACRWP
jgi:hypothetical protein